MCENPRRPIYAEYRGPGPLACDLPTTVGSKGHSITKPMAPAFTLGPRCNYPMSEVPGPCYTIDPKITNRGSQTGPSFSLRGRTKPKGIEESPGPGAYNNHNTKHGILSTDLQIPNFSMRSRVKWPFKNESPPSSKYTLPSTLGNKALLTKRVAPSWSFSGRLDHGGVSYSLIKNDVPAPNVYTPANVDVLKPNHGVYTLKGRTQTKNYNTIMENPGPGAYDPRLSRNGPKGYSMGVKHSEFTVPFINNDDF